MNKEIELAWAAGLFDGEGTSNNYGRKRADGLRCSIRMSLSQKDTGPDILLRLQTALGMGKVSERISRPGVWVWTLQGQICKDAMKLMWPYLSKPKKRQFKAVLEKQELARSTCIQKRVWKQ